MKNFIKLIDQCLVFVFVLIGIILSYPIMAFAIGYEAALREMDEIKKRGPEYKIKS